MATDWIQVDKNLATKPETLNIAAASGLTPDAVAWTMIKFWFWVDDHVPANGRVALSSLAAFAAQFGNDEKFWSAVLSEKWLRKDEKGFVIPGHKSRFSESAKKRKLNAARQARYRAKEAAKKKPEIPVTHVTRDSVTDASPRRDETKRDETRKDESNLRASTSTLDVGAPKDFDPGNATNTAPEETWANAAHHASRACRILGLGNLAQLKPPDRSLLLKGSVLGEGLFADSVEATRVRYAASPAPDGPKCAYLSGVLASKLKDLGRDFKTCMAQVKVPQYLLTGQQKTGDVATAPEASDEKKPSVTRDERSDLEKSNAPRGELSDDEPREIDQSMVAREMRKLEAATADQDRAPPSDG